MLIPCGSSLHVVLTFSRGTQDSKKNKKMVDLVGKHIQEKIVSGDDSVRDYWGNALRSSAEDIVSNLEGAVTKVSSRTVESKHTVCLCLYSSCSVLWAW